MKLLIKNGNSKELMVGDCPSSLSLCGIRLDTLKLGDLIELLGRAIDKSERMLILNHNLHSLYLYETNVNFRLAYSLASFVYIDGIPVVWLGRAAGLSITSAHRITFLDSFETILSEAARRGWRVFYLGSTRSVNEQALATLGRQFPNLKISGHDGFFAKSGPESDDIVAKINGFQTDILFVGMGMPVQEQWLTQHHSFLEVPVVLTSGATLDYVIGDAYKPPAWAGPIGLYGVLRFCSDPKRLWRRYLLEPLVLLKKLGPSIVRQRLSGRSTHIGGEQIR